MWKNIKNLIIDSLFPKNCFGCRKEGSLLCEDCKSLLDISGFHRNFKTKNLGDLYFAAEYGNSLVGDLIRKFKYEPFVKDLAPALSSLIIDHLRLLEEKVDFSNFILIPVPLENKKLKWRGFNQAEEIARELSKFLKIPLSSGILTKKKQTRPQVELSGEERKNNTKEAFELKDGSKVPGRKILLVDDVYTTGSTMEECAKVLKASGAGKIIGIAIARANPAKDSA